MTVHTFHLAKPGLVGVVKALLRPPTSGRVAGLHHAECMIPMRLGAPVLSPWRWQVGRLAMFAAWEDEAAVDDFLAGTAFGRALARGWHVRLEFLRRWGHVAALDGLPPIDRHSVAMVERQRKDFHLEFTTLRFACLGEYGEWDGRTSIVAPRSS
jgi:hypothetical protein